MSRQFPNGKELKLLIFNKEAKELFKWANKLSPTLAEKVKHMLAYTMSGSPRGSFLWHVFYYYECDVGRVKKELRRQYKEQGTIKMGEHWGFHYQVVEKGLHKIGIKIKPRIYNHAPHGLASEAFGKYGGVEKVLKQFGNITKFSRVCKVSATNLIIYLKKQGYCYDREKGKWKIDR